MIPKHQSNELHAIAIAAGSQKNASRRGARCAATGEAKCWHHGNHRAGRRSMANELLAAGCRIRAVLRDEAKASAWRERGCEIALASMDDAASLAAAFSGAQAVFVLLPPTLRPHSGLPEARRHVAALVEALNLAKPERVVCLSTIGRAGPAGKPADAAADPGTRPCRAAHAGRFPCAPHGSSKTSHGTYEGARNTGMMPSFLQTSRQAGADGRDRPTSRTLQHSCCANDGWPSHRRTRRPEPHHAR